MLLLLAASCTVPKKYQADKPFVYRTNISVNANIRASEKQDLEQKLQNQLDDSLKTKTISYAGIYRVLLRPPVFDTTNIMRSRIFMTALLNAQGYFHPEIKDTFDIDTVNNQKRVTINFRVMPGKQLKLDSTNIVMETPELQVLAAKTRAQSFLKKNDPYSIQLVSAELDRLLLVFRNNGYYKLGKEDIYAEIDTVVAGLIDPTLDPFEQLRLLEELKKKRESPTINVVIKQRPVTDSTDIQRFYLGDITVYPDLPLLEDTVAADNKTALINKYHFIYNSSKFKLPFISSNIALKPGSLFKQNNYFTTINTFNRLGAWQKVDLSLTERGDSIPVLDAILKLYPAKKQSLNIDLDASRNIGDVLTTGQLFGTGINIKLLNRNAYHESIQTTTNARFGVELGRQLVQTMQTSLAHNISFPKLLLPFKIKNSDSLLIPKTNFNINATYTNRRDFFEARSINTSWGYEWTKRNHTWQWVPLNFELTAVNKKDSLIHLEEKIPSLAFAFNNGLIIGAGLGIVGYNIAWSRPYSGHLNFFRTRFEESGALLGFIKNLERGELRRFFKLETEYKHFINYSASSWAFRIYGGYGYVYGKSGDSPEYTLPFFKAFWAGGPYSMRAWQVRQLGPGTALTYDTTAGRSIDRFGNMQLEGNIEYRFRITSVAGIKVHSALFVDMGNIWSKEFDKTTGNSIPEAEFRLNKLYKDLAVGGGTSLRFDFDFFLIRLDWAYKLKNPRYADINDGWFHNITLASGQFQLGIGYPF